jgi:cobalt-zinc-cadmium resistance protein CzcA
MIKKLIDFALDHRMVTLGVILVFIAYGYYAYKQVPIEAFPDPDDVHVQVITLWPGQAAEEIESQVTRPTEQQLNGTAGLTALRSVSMFGLSVVTCTFEDSVTDSTARAAVLEKMQNVTLPTGAQWQLAPLTTSTGEVFRYVIRGPREKLEELRALEDWVIEPQIRQVPGVADVNAFGGGIKQYQVIVKPESLLQQKVTLAQVFTALQNNNANTGGNVLRTGEQMLVIRGVGALNDPSDSQNLADIRNIWITNQDGHPVYIRDVADVETGMAPRQGVVGWFRCGGGRSAGQAPPEPARPTEHQIARSGEAQAAELPPLAVALPSATQPSPLAARDEEIDDVVEAIVLQRKGTNALQVLEGIREKVKFLNDKMLRPKGIEIVPTYDRGDLVHQTVHTVMHNLVEGAVLILIISLIFTSSIRAALIICLVIPISLLTAFLVLYLYGIPANLLSFGAVDFGILVDAAVVIVEAILVQKVLSPPDVDFKELTRKTSENLGRPMLFAKLIFITALIPIFTFQRVEGRIFRPMALTITGAMVGAIVMTLTLVPIAASFLLRGVRASHENLVARALKASYGWLMSWVLRFKPVTVLLALGVLALAVAWGTRLGSEFLPKLDEGNIWLTVEMPLSVSKDKAKELERRVRSILKSFPESRQIYSQLGRPDDGTDSKGFNNLEVGVDLLPHEQWTTRDPATDRIVDKDGLISQMNAKLQELPGLEFNFSQVIEDNVEEALSGVKGELAIKLFGDDLQVLQQKGEEVRQVLAQISGVADLAVEKLSGQPNLTIKLDREGLARYGVDVQTALNFVQTGLGGQAAGSVLEGQRRFDLTVRLSEAARSSINRIADLWIDTPAGQRIPITQLAQVKTEEGASRIGRDNNSRRIALKCGIRGRDMGSFVEEAKRQVESKVKLPSGYYMTWEGQFENQQRATARLKVIVPLSLLGVFIILSWAFQRFRYSFLILANIPFAFVGSIAALYFTGTHLSVSAMIGFIALSGVSVQNGIVLVGQFNQLRHKGLPLPQAVLEGSKLRVRPVLMTALMAAIGMYPAAVSQGIGSEVQRPLALVIVGGMLSAAVLTLIVLPVLYELFEKYFPAPVTVPEGLVE